MLRSAIDVFITKGATMIIGTDISCVRTKINKPNGMWSGLYKEDNYQAFPQFDGHAYTPLLIASGNIGWINVRCVDILESNTPLPPTFNM